MKELDSSDSLGLHLHRHDGLRPARSRLANSRPAHLAIHRFGDPSRRRRQRRIQIA